MAIEHPTPERFPLHPLEDPAQIDQARRLALDQYQRVYRPPDLPHLTDPKTLDLFYPPHGQNEIILGTTLDDEVVATCHFEFSIGSFGGLQLVRPLDPSLLVIHPHELCLEIGRLAFDLDTLMKILPRPQIRTFFKNFYNGIFSLAAETSATRLFIVVKPTLLKSLTKCLDFELDPIPCRLLTKDEHTQFSSWHYGFLKLYFAKPTNGPSLFIVQTTNFKPQQ